MSIRSKWCDFDKETRKYIKKRDNNKCVICGNKGALQIMHIFINRSHGGKGSKENGCLGCVKCHKILDNPIGEKENLLSSIYEQRCMKYLIKKENINYDKDFIESLKFDKKKYIMESQPKLDNIQMKKYDRCKDCVMLVKRKSFNNSIPTYYCKYKKVNLNKTTKACNKFRRKNNDRKDY